VGAATLAAVNDLAPPTILAEASRLNFSTRLFNLLVTNIPGPQIPLYLLGRQLEDLFPLAFLPKNHALAVAIMSYNGGLDYGLLGDYDALPDIDVIAEGIDASLKELLTAVQARSSSGTNGREKSRNGGPKANQILPSAGARPKSGPAADMRAKRTRRPRPGG
jgi:diacylglycerol O-acyltransferase / wax synthase